ncbi:MAG: hypothetical protein U0Q15_20640 [Kineosporiaceae bacterium]
MDHSIRRRMLAATAGLSGVLVAAGLLTAVPGGPVQVEGAAATSTAPVPRSASPDAASGTSTPVPNLPVSTDPDADRSVAGAASPAHAVTGSAAPRGGDVARSPRPAASSGLGDVHAASLEASAEEDEFADEDAVSGPVVGAPPEVAKAVARLEVAGGPDPSAPPVPRVLAGRQAAVPAPNVTPTLTPASRHPVTPAFPAWLEAASSYEPEDTCDPVAKPGAIDLQTMLTVTYGADINSNIVRACSSANTGHKAGRALDWMVNSRNSVQASYGDAYVAWLLATDKTGGRYAMARRMGIMYVIWRSRIFALYTGTWREYSDCLTVRTEKADDNTCHRNHVHTSMSWAGARRETSWWTLGHGLPVCSAETPTMWAPMRAGVAHGVTATRVLDSAAGTGTPRAPLPCAVPAGVGVGISVLGKGGVPTSGVAAVRLKITAKGLGRASSVARVGPALPPSGTAVGAATLAVPASATSTVTTWVPVHAGGLAYLRIGSAPADLSVDVVGWAPAAPFVTPRGKHQTVTGRVASPPPSPDVRVTHPGPGSRVTP